MEQNAHSTGITAATLPASTLPSIDEDLLCYSYINSFCRKGDSCGRSHQLCLLNNKSPDPHAIMEDKVNRLSKLPRLRPTPFEDDGPGDMSRLGPRHDNDHVEIQHISILPTVDEILSSRSPYMPSKDPHSSHRLPLGRKRLLDIYFRQLRYENVESIIDCCYHASQQLLQSQKHSHLTDYDENNRTPKGSHYSLFRDVAFEDIIFDDQKGIMFRVSFACPFGLRGRQMYTSNHLEKGMLVALIGLVDGARLSVTFMEISCRQSTEGMKRQTGNDLRATVILSFADSMDICATRRLLYNFRGILNETFVLVELPGALLAGFRWTLKQLQTQSVNTQEMAFESTIAPSSASESPSVLPPTYAMEKEFQFELSILRKNSGPLNRPTLTLKPADILSDPDSAVDVVQRVCDETHLDHGQATALCHSLCRSLAFVQGPPGSGKTFLGVALARVILASRPSIRRRPILVVCLTNHALDSFLSGLRDAGIASFVRYGANSKEEWTKLFQLRYMSQRFKKTADERVQIRAAVNAAESHGTECQSWCEALNSDALSWPAVREYLHEKDPGLLSQFIAVEKTETLKLMDIRLARKAGGFAFEYWCQGGDIKDVDLLLEAFRNMLGNDKTGLEGDPRAIERRDRVVENIRWNVVEVQSRQADNDIWKLPMYRREELFLQWKLEIGLETILDRTAEAHRRHQVSMTQKREVYEQLDVRMLENMDVIAMTTTACAKHRSAMEKLGPQTVLCEEAGEVMEAQLLCTLLPSVEHYVSIGDPLQLRPQVKEQSLSLETLLGSLYRLDESLMERLMLPKNPGIRPIPSETLSIQRRMHPEIADLMRATLYPYLKDHESTWEDRSVNGLADRIWWLDHHEPEDSGDLKQEYQTSFSNTFEVEMIAGLVHYLIDSNEYDLKDITILTPYNGQLAALTRKLKGSYSLWLSEKDRETLCNDGLLAPEDANTNVQITVDVGDMLRLATVDNFQGEESKIVILSLVRSNDAGHVGFLKTINRINVACSRARSGFYIVGNAELMIDVPMWHLIIAQLTSKAKIGPSFRICCPRHPEIVHHIGEPQGWYKAPTCRQSCDFQFPCGHVCLENCHASALHDRVGCTQQCEKILEGCGHQCSKQCGQPCGDCDYQEVEKKLSCGHNAIISCSNIKDGRIVEKVLCNAKISEEVLPCGHEQDVICHKRNVVSLCTNVCGKLLDCGHTCKETCSTCTKANFHPDCEEKCLRTIEKCGHECRSRCHAQNACPPCRNNCRKRCKHGRCNNRCSEECEECTQSCDWTCHHEGSCSSICCLPCVRFPCQQLCVQKLACGHPCPSLCGEACPAVCPHCETGKAPSEPQICLPCGHNFEVKWFDEYVRIQQLYDISKDGIFRSVVASIGNQSNVNTVCPTCNTGFTSVRRYAIHHQLEKMERALDSIYRRIYRETSLFLNLMYSAKQQLDGSFQAFQSSLKAGPLNGRKNEVKIRERTYLVEELQRKILGFKDNVVVAFESSMASLAKFLPSDGAFVTWVMPSRIRLEATARRCQLIVLEERLRIIDVLEHFAEQSHHTTILVNGLRGLTILEAQQELHFLKTIMDECDTKYLKRLECEVRLLHCCFQLGLRKLRVNTVDGGEEQQQIEKSHDLCIRFPESAGLLMPICVNIQRAMDTSRQDTQTIYASEFKPVFWSLPKHQSGSLTQCPHGHLFSASTHSDCPECGREVILSENSSPTPLKTEAFVLAMRAAPAKFDPGAYRRKPLSESSRRANSSHSAEKEEDGKVEAQQDGQSGTENQVRKH